MDLRLTGILLLSGQTDKYIRFYHTKAWHDARQETLTRQHYLCQDCLREGKITVAKTVHHIIPLRDDWDNRLDQDNLEVICLEHHNEEHPEKGSGNKKYFKHEAAVKKRTDVFKFPSNKDDDKLFW